MDQGEDMKAFHLIQFKIWQNKALMRTTEQGEWQDTEWND